MACNNRDTLQTPRHNPAVFEQACRVLAGVRVLKATANDPESHKKCISTLIEALVYPKRTSSMAYHSARKFLAKANRFLPHPRAVSGQPVLACTHSLRPRCTWPCLLPLLFSLSSPRVARIASLGFRARRDPDLMPSQSRVSGPVPGVGASVFLPVFSTPAALIPHHRTPNDPCLPSPKKDAPNCPSCRFLSVSVLFLRIYYLLSCGSLSAFDIRATLSRSRFDPHFLTKAILQR